MTIEALLIWLIIGAIAGYLAGVIVTGYGFGVVGNVVVGIVGAFIAAWLFPRLGLLRPAISLDKLLPRPSVPSCCSS